MEQLSGKNIVICLDGTGNLFNEDNSNVVKLFRVLTRDPREQVAYYDPGVGTLANPEFKTPVGKVISKGLGLAFGSGLLKNVEEAYTYLMENYEVNDKIFIFGFSRGAYTARALAGFIHSVGLLEKGCQNLLTYAMNMYTEEKIDWEVLRTFRHIYGRKNQEGKQKLPIRFLGLWDTVSTLGWIYDPKFHPYTDNNPSVQVIRHALAIDERRVFFQPALWGTKDVKAQDVKEVWFKGVHSDVGGGYSEENSGLAKVALEWMVAEALKFGLVIEENKYARYVKGTDQDGKYSKPDPNSNPQLSLKGLWWMVQYLPLRVWNPALKCKTIQWIPKQKREIKEGSTLHRTVLGQIISGGYKPSNICSLDETELRKRYKIEGNI